MSQPTRKSALAAALIAVTAAAALHAPSADAHWRRGGWFVGGVVIGAALAPRYVYSAPAYVYPPTVVYSAPPPVVYTAPPPVVYTSPPPVVVQPAPVTIAAPAPQPALPQAQPLEERLRRLRAVCDEGLITAQECQARREQILREL